MRYFVYHDNRIVGPLSPDELQGLGGVEPDALVCPEDASGRRDEDWKAAREVGELSPGLRTSLSTAVADDPLPGGESGLLERLELESLGVPREEGEDWLAGFFDDADFRTRWGHVLPKDEDAPQSLSVAQNRIRELSDQLAALQKRIKDLEAQQRDLLSQMRGNAQTGKLEAMRAPSLEPPEAPAAAPVESPSEPALPSIGIRRDVPVVPPTETPVPPPRPARAPETEFQKRAFKFTPPKAPAEGPKLGLPKLGAAKTFRVVKKEDAGADAAGTPVYEWNVSSQAPAAGLPEAKKAGPMAPPPPTVIAPAPSGPSFEPPQPRLPSSGAPPPTQPGPLPVNPPTPAPPPPVTMQFAAPAQAPAPAPMPSFGAVPTPTLTPLTPEAAGPAMTPSRSNAETFGAAQTPFDVMKRLAKPEAPKTLDKPKERSAKVFYIAGAALVVVLVVLFAFFLRNPKDLKTMVNMGSDHKPLGAASDDSDLKNQVFTPKAPEPPAPAPVAAPPPAPVAPPAPAPAAPDQGEAAKDLVKNYPLDADRGTVAQRLSFMFTADPGSGNTEEWTSGGVEANVYIVQYRVIPGPNSKLKEAISYVFEANLAHGTVKGNNPPAVQLLAGNTAPAKPKKVRRAAPRRRAPKRVAAPPKEVPLMPLPSDTDLLPPAEGDAQFKSDTIN